MYKLSPTSETLGVEERAILYAMIEERGVMLDPIAFSESVSLESYLSEGEEITDFIKWNEHAQFYKVEFNPGEFLYGIQSYGIDTLFTMDGKPISLDPEFDSDLAEEIASTPSGWVLAPCNSIHAVENMGIEFIRFSSTDVRCFDGTDGGTRLQLVLDGRPVCGMAILNDVIQNLHTLSSEQGENHAERLLQHAQHLFPNLKSSEFFPGGNRSGFGSRSLMADQAYSSSF